LQQAYNAARGMEMSGRLKLFFWGLFLSLLSVSYLSASEPVTVYYSDEGKFSIPFGKSYNYSDCLVKRAVDGDTLQLENGERVRLIGIDTPEMHESNKLNRDAGRSGQDVTTIQKLGRRSYEFTTN
jgi:endonuclease YncB( thermonuclease family)